MNKVKIQTPPCIMCGNTTLLEVDEQAYENWLDGMLIQKAFPDMSPTTRELMMTGTHDHCWDEITKEEE